MNKLQKQALDIALEGHNLLITGAGGSGKTYVLKQIIRQLQATLKNVDVTASTGMASTCFEEFASTTLHKWSGLGVQYRRETPQEIVETILSRPHEQIVKADVLVIDEIGMVSAQTFDLIEFICRKVRNSNKYFGGLQLILSGSFSQLPPVPNKACNDIGKYCFESDVLKECIPHHVHLSQMMRQEDTALATLVKELESGTPTAESEQLLQSLGRTIAVPKGEKATVLLGTNFAVDCYNQEMLHQNPGDIRYYRAVDEGKQN